MEGSWVYRTGSSWCFRYDSAATMAGLVGIVRVTTHDDFTDWMARKVC
jgi:hypothetical protein